jgi:hypothetical protein
MHEMTHYFGALRFNHLGYVEGVADYMRYQGNLLMGWDDIAARLRRTYSEHCFRDAHAQYHAAAGELIEAHELGGFGSVRAFIDELLARDYRNAYAPVWLFLDLPGLKKAARAYCLERRGLADLYPIAAEARFRMDVSDGLWDLAHYREILGDPKRFQFLPKTQERLPGIKSALQAYSSLLAEPIPAGASVIGALESAQALEPSAVEAAKAELKTLLDGISAHAEAML